MGKVNARIGSGRHGERYVEEIVESWGCAYTRNTGGDGYGLDGYVLDRISCKRRPLQYRVQVKTTKRKFGSRASETFRAPINDPQFLKFWKDVGLCLLVFVEKEPSEVAYWHVVRKNDTLPLYVSRHNVFGPDSRDNIVAELRKERKQQSLAVVSGGEILDLPLTKSIQKEARECYRRLKRSVYQHPTLGRIVLTWKAWRHITRNKRTSRRIRISWLFLPCLPAILTSQIRPVYSRNLGPVLRGNEVYHRTLLVFEALVIMRQGGDARVQVSAAAGGGTTVAARSEPAMELLGGSAGAW